MGKDMDIINLYAIFMTLNAFFVKIPTKYIILRQAQDERKKTIRAELVEAL